MKQIKMGLLASMIMIFTACGGGSSSSTTSTAVSNTETPQTIAIDKIKTYAADNNLPMPTIQDYLDAGVTGVTVDNIDDINIVIADLEAEDVDTQEEIQAWADELGVILPENSVPVANAGVDQDVNTTSTVTLDGALSSDADSDTLTYEWSIISQPEGSSPDIVATDWQLQFSADVAGTYVVQLIVNDGSIDSAPDTITIIVDGNTLPVANAGDDQTLYYTETLNLSGSLSTDDSEIVSYTWTEGETVLSSEMNLSTTGFSVGTHILTLTVLDDDGETSTDEVVVNIFDDFTNLLPMEENGGTKIISSSTINGTTTTTLSAGSGMYFKITNDTNREFTINQFQIISTYNGVDTIRAFSNNIAGILGDNKLTANESVSLGHTLSSSETANIWIGIYYLTDDATGETFTNIATWNGTVFR